MFGAHLRTILVTGLNQQREDILSTFERSFALFDFLRQCFAQCVAYLFKAIPRAKPKETKLSFT